MFEKEKQRKEEKKRRDPLEIEHEPYQLELNNTYNVLKIFLFLALFFLLFRLSTVD